MIPRIASHASNGDIVPPVSITVLAQPRPVRHAQQHTTPPVRSWWPPRYFVAEWIT